MKRVNRVALCLIYLLSSGLLLFGQEFQTYESMEYGLIKPDSYDAKKKYPLVVCLHGGCPSEKNTGKQKKEGKKSGHKTPKFGLTDEVQRKNPCFVLIPQAKKLWWDGGNKHSPIDEILDFIDDELGKKYSIDKKRLYVIGVSDGGTAILHALAWHPETFAAAIPLSGWLRSSESTRKMVKSDTAVWWFAGTDDKISPWSGTERVLEDYKRAKGNLKLTVIEDGGHSAPGQAYKSLCDGTPVKGTRLVTTSKQCDTATTNPIEWLFKQSLR